MKTFKHSGAVGDLIYSLPVVKHFGGGDFYLHLNQLDWIGQHYYGAAPNPFHQGRLTERDFEYMQDFMLAQEYIGDFKILDPKTDAITHNLDKFRVPFVGHPGNYVDIYADCFNIIDRDTLRNTAWLTVPKSNPVARCVVNRTQRWKADPAPDKWKELVAQYNGQVVFVGLPDEHEKFEKEIGCSIPYYPTNTMLELASVVAGAELFLGNQSQCLALAVGLGKEFYCELRRDLPKERNECYFPDRIGANWF